jgi:adenylosuccinate synthase
MQIVLLSGPSCVGKSSLATHLVNEFGFRRISTSGFLRRVAAQQGALVNKASLQTLGDELDKQTNFRWVADAFLEEKASIDSSRWLLDSLRKEPQIADFRDRFGRSICHVHLIAPEERLRSRYINRVRDDPAATPYDQMVEHPNEISSRQLGVIADLLFDVTTTPNDEIATEILRHYRGEFGEQGRCD